MKRFIEGCLCIWGGLVYRFQCLNRVALGKYKTHVIKKHNPGIISIGGGGILEQLRPNAYWEEQLS